jgi:hypothetical protein
MQVCGLKPLKENIGTSLGVVVNPPFTLFLFHISESAAGLRLVSASIVDFVIVAPQCLKSLLL